MMRFTFRLGILLLTLVTRPVAGAEVFTGQGFEGWSFTDTEVNPPDPACAVGSSMIVLVGNDIVRWHHKNTGIQVSSYSLRTFFDVTETVWDPSVIYDEEYNQFVLIGFEGPSASRKLLVGVSNDAEPADESDWHKYSFDVPSVGSQPFDFPRLGVGPDAVYVTDVRQNRVRLFDKDSLFAGLDVYMREHDPVEESNAPEWRKVSTRYLVPATMYGNPPDEIDVFLVGERPSHADSLVLITVRDPLGDISFDYQIVDVDEGYPPDDAPQKGGSQTIDINGGRLLEAVWIDGRIWIVNNGCPDPDRIGSSVGWFSVDTSTPGSLAVAGSGYITAEDIDDDPVSAYFPSVDVDDFGNVGISFSASSDSIYIGAYVAFIFADGTVSPTQTLAEGEAYYNRPRWGDYSGMARDPDGHRFWAFNAYAKPETTEPIFGTRWGSYYVENIDRTVPGIILAVSPNPAYGLAKIYLSLDQGVTGSVDVYDLQGRRIRHLLDFEGVQGTQEFFWDMKTDQGRDVARGIYFIRAELGEGKSATQKLLVVGSRRSN